MRSLKSPIHGRAFPFLMATSNEWNRSPFFLFFVIEQQAETKKKTHRLSDFGYRWPIHRLEPAEMVKLGKNEEKNSVKRDERFHQWNPNSDKRTGRGEWEFLVGRHFVRETWIVCGGIASKAGNTNCHSIVELAENNRPRLDAINCNIIGGSAIRNGR